MWSGAVAQRRAKRAGISVIVGKERILGTAEICLCESCRQQGWPFKARESRGSTDQCTVSKGYGDIKGDPG